MQRITPCLWFDGNAEEAINFYMSVFREGKIGDVMRRGETAPGELGSVLSITFELDGQSFIALNGGPMYKFTPAISMFVQCDSQDEVDYYWERLLEGGTPNRCGWLTDRFGLSWQVVPHRLGKMLRDPDKARANRVMQALMTMVKLDLKALDEAYSGTAS